MLANRLTAAMVALVLITALSVSWLARRSLEDAAVGLELSRMNTNTQSLAARFEAYVTSANADVLAQARSPLVQEMVARMTGGTESSLGQPRARLADQFVAQLEAKPAYLQMRLLAADDAGREVVRVDRSGPGGAIRIVTDRDLQAKGHREYFQHAVLIETGDVFVSPIELNREEDALEVPHIPVLRTATPIGTGPAPIAIVVINVDMRPALNEMRSLLYASSAVYVANDAGEYLVHATDSSRAFAHDRMEGTFRWQPDFPDLETTLADSSRGAIITSAPGGTRVAASAAVARMARGPAVTIIETAPYDEVTALAGSVYRTGILAASGAALLAIVAAVFVARSATRPLAQMTAAVQQLPGEFSTTHLPVGASGEIGILARAVSGMAAEIEKNTGDLREEIAERQRAETALHAQLEKESALLTVVESTSEAIVAMDVDGRITGWNPGAERLYGYEAAAAIGQNVNLIILDDRRAEANKLHDRVRAGGRVEQFETVRQDSGGRRIDISLNISPVTSPTGNITGISETAQDISQRKRVEKNFRQVFEASPSGLCLVDSKGHVLLVNRAVEQLFGYERHEMLGQPVERLVPTRYRDGHGSLRQTYTQRPEARPMGAGRDLHACRKDGSEFAVEIGLNPIEDGEDIQILCSIIDVTERKRVLKQMADYASQLELSNAELEQFAYVVSHDIKAPLRGIATVTEWIAQDFGHLVDDDGRENLRLMVDRVDRLNKLVDGILTYSRAGRIEISRTRLDVETVVGDVVASMAPPANITIRVEGPFPRFDYDETQLRQVLQNLIDNGVNHLGKPDGEVVVSSESTSDEHRISVRDNGVGIPERHFDRIFGLFQTLQPKDVSKSAGAGLAIVKRIVERNGGQVHVKSRVDIGTEFTFTIPRAGKAGGAGRSKRS